MKVLFNLTTIAIIATLASSPALADTGTPNVVPVEDVQWGYLNPLRGDQSPGAADLWGDRTQDTASGMLVRFNKGFASPAHIHNITYRAIVIAGQMHNDDPKAERMWMPPGSFWTQPAGENHTTAANSPNNLIYLEIDSGPYLVEPSANEFDNGERAINLHRDNSVWLNNRELENIHVAGVEATYLWGDTSSLHGTMIKLPAGFSGRIVTPASEFRAVVVAGTVVYQASTNRPSKTLRPGSYLESAGDASLSLSNPNDTVATVYIRTNAHYLVE